MANLFDKFVANGFADFEGLSITGILPIKEEVFNELLAELLQKRRAPTPDAPPAPPSTNNLGEQLLRMVEKAEVRASEGVITLEIEIAR